MTMTVNRFFNTIKILQSTSSSLRDLAELSGFDPSTFYDGADLRGLDISQQNLVGLNFQNADLRDANLEGIIVDDGAFNNANVDQKFDFLKDEFEFFISDILSEDLDYFHVFCRFRKFSLESAIELTKNSYKNFAHSSYISETTLRRARRGEVVSIDTAINICQFIKDATDKSASFSGSVNFISKYMVYSPIKQPFIQVLELNDGGGFSNIKKRDISELVETASHFFSLRGDDKSKNSPVIVRRPPEIVRILKEYDYDGTL